MYFVQRLIDTTKLLSITFLISRIYLLKTTYHLSHKLNIKTTYGNILPYKMDRIHLLNSLKTVILS